MEEMDLTLDSRINVWSNNLQKIDNIFNLVINMLKEQRLIADGIEEHSLLRPREFDKTKVVIFVKNKENFKKSNIPKELLMGERILSSGDEELLDYILENIVTNSITAYDKNISRLDRIDTNIEIDEGLKDKLALFYSNYNAHYKKPYIFVMIEDISIFKGTRTIELLKNVFELGRSKCVVSCFGSIIDNNVEFLTGFVGASVTLVDKMKKSDVDAWWNTNYFGLGDISKLSEMNDEDYLFIKGNLYEQGRGVGIKPYILTIREYVKEKNVRKLDDVKPALRKVDVYKDDVSQYDTFPKELAEYRYNLQEETIKYMASFSDL